MSEYTPSELKVAAAQGNVEAVRELLAKGYDPNAADALGGPALHSAAMNGHTEVVALLLAHGANPNARATRNITPLHWAAEGGHAAVVELLLAHGAAVNVPNEPGKQTPLHLAAFYGGSAQVVALLLKHGADVSARTDGGGTALDGAKTPEIVQLLQARAREGKQWWQFWR